MGRANRVGAPGRATPDCLRCRHGGRHTPRPGAGVRAGRSLFWTADAPLAQPRRAAGQRGHRPRGGAPQYGRSLRRPGRRRGDQARISSLVVAGRRGRLDTAMRQGGGGQAGVLPGRNRGRRARPKDVDPEHVLLGVLRDAEAPARWTRRTRRVRAVLGFPPQPGPHPVQAVIQARGQTVQALREAILAELHATT
jgi:hypothetical protein